MKRNFWTGTKTPCLAALTEKPTLASEKREADNLEDEADRKTGGGHKSGGKADEKDVAPRQMAPRTNPPVATI